MIPVISGPSKTGEKKRLAMWCAIAFEISVESAKTYVPRTRKSFALKFMRSLPFTQEELLRRRAEIGASRQNWFSANCKKGKRLK
jgi:hypothetical protein